MLFEDLIVGHSVCIQIAAAAVRKHFDKLQRSWVRPTAGTVRY